MVKLIILCRRKKGLTYEEFVIYWKTTHARLAINDQNFWSRVRRYVQNYCLDDPKKPPMEREWDGVVELWFDDFAAMDAAFGSKATIDGLIADLDNFIDTSKVSSLTVNENVIFAGK